MPSRPRASRRPARGRRSVAASAAPRPSRTLRQKEWTLLLRDPWLVSQTLMQLLYLLPPALLLWRSYGEGTGALVVLVPVLVMAAGQLAGGLAWLAISGEDAPDLVATAPVPRAPYRARQGRGRARRHRDRVCAVHRGAGVSLALWRARRGARHSGGRGRRHRHPVLVPQAGDARAISATARPPRALRPSRRRSRRSRGRRPPRSRPAARWFALFPAAIGLGILAAARWMSPHTSH